MIYDLARVDYTICGITYPDTLKLLSGFEQKAQQKFAVGDKNGVLQCLSIKDEEPIVQFKTLPGKPITSVQIAVSIGDNAHKIFAASGNEVKGYTRRGKVFLSIETSVSETITSMSVLGSDLILCSGRTVTFYRDLKEIYSYACEDRVLDIVSFTIPNTNRVRLLIINANKSAIILENGQQQSRIYISSGPTRLLVPTTIHTTEVCTFYGAADGSIGLIFYEETELKSKCLVDGRDLGSVMCLGWFVNNAGTHLTVGRHDGSIQLYLVENENFHDKPRLKFTYFCGEPVTSVCGGCISSEEPEILALTFSGRIFALRSRRLVSTTGILNNASQEALTIRRTKLEAEIARLEKQTSNERDKYQRNTRSLIAGVSTPPLLDLQYELIGATQDNWQEVRFISAVPLDVLFIYCDYKLEMQTDSAAVLSTCPSQRNASDLLVTVRCQAGTRRLWLRMRLENIVRESKIEGSRVLVYVLPAGAPRVARLVKLYLPLLPYYSKHEIIEDDYKRCWCELRLSGGFSVAEITSWLTEILPSELPRPTTSVAFARSHTLLGTLLICRYQRGDAVFKSDDISCISLIKDIISNSSVKSGNRVEMSTDVPDNYCLRSFQFIKEKFKEEYNLHKNIKMKNAFKYLDLDENVIDECEPMLCNDYIEVLKSTGDKKETYFEQLVDIVSKWYNDWCMLTLNKSWHKENLPKLLAALKVCMLEEIEDILHFN